MKSFSDYKISKKRLALWLGLFIFVMFTTCTYIIPTNSASILDSNSDYYSREINIPTDAGTDNIIEIVNRTVENGMESDYRNVRFLDENNEIIPQQRITESNVSSVRLQLDTDDGLTTIREQWCESWEISNTLLFDQMVENSQFTQNADWTSIPTGNFNDATSIIANGKFLLSLGVFEESATVYGIQTVDLTNVDNLYVNYGITELTTTENADGKMLILIDDIEKASIDTITSTTEVIDVSSITGDSAIKAVCSGTANDGTIIIEGYFKSISAPSIATPTVIEVTPSYKDIELVEATLNTASVTTETTVETTTEVVTTTNETTTTVTATSTENFPTVYQYYPDSDKLPIAEKIYSWLCSTLNLDIPHGEIETPVGSTDKIIVNLDESKKCEWYLNDNLTSTVTSNVPSTTLNSVTEGENTVKLTVYNSDNSTNTHKWDWNVITASVNTSN